MTKKHKAQKHSKNKTKSATAANVAAPFIEHLQEFRRRLFIVAVSIVAWSTLAYFFQIHIVDFLMAPAHGANFIYTTVGGGIDFLFKVCIYTGLLFSIPVIFYQTLRYLQPILGRHSFKFILTMSAFSGLLAVAGILFGYYLGLPSALQFLLHQFGAERITALITVQSYLSFVIWYTFGSSLMFQIPLVIYIINRIKPLRLRTLFKFERWVILVSFVVAAMVNPSPRIYDMAILAVPMVLSYQIAIFLVWRTNRKRRGKRAQKLATLFEQDAARRREREERLKRAKHMPGSALPVAAAIKTAKATPVTPKPGPPHHLAASAPSNAPLVNDVAPTSGQPLSERSFKYANSYLDVRPVRGSMIISE
jgi:sec-independent protein translocase protein TatC